MPRQAMDYSKCVIYKIVCNDESVTECYVGHTTNFVKRKYSHKNNCKTSNIKLYQMIRQYGGFDNFTMTPICEFPCENNIQACIKEEECKIELQAQLNTQKCFADSYTKEYRIQYAQERKDHITEYKKEWYKINVEYVKKYNKQYAQKNKDEINEQRRLKYAQKKLVQSEN